VLYITFNFGHRKKALLRLARYTWMPERMPICHGDVIFDLVLTFLPHFLSGGLDLLSRTINSINNTLCTPFYSKLVNNTEWNFHLIELFVN
jgi:hypothetical protein